MAQETHPCDYAFPVAPGDVPYWQPGMSLRDYAAIHGEGLPPGCTHKYAEHFNFDEKPSEGDAIGWAKWWAKAEWTARFINADAMLSAREATQ